MAGFSSKLVFNLVEHPHSIIVTGPPTVPGQHLNPGPLNLEASALLPELTRLAWSINGGGQGRDGGRGRGMVLAMYMLCKW